MASINDIVARLMDEALDERDALHVQLDMANSASAYWQQAANNHEKVATELRKALNVLKTQLSDAEETLKQYRTVMGSTAAPQEAEPKVDVIDARSTNTGKTVRHDPSEKSWVGAPTANDLSWSFQKAKDEIENLKGAQALFGQANATLVSRNNDLLNKNISLEERARKAEKISEVFMRDITNEEAMALIGMGNNLPAIKQKLRDFIARRAAKATA